MDEAITNRKLFRLALIIVNYTKNKNSTDFPGSAHTLTDQHKEISRKLNMLKHLHLKAYHIRY